MKVIKSSVITRFQNELKILEKKKHTVPAEEKQFVEEIMEGLRKDLGQLQTTRTIGEFFDAHERVNAQARLREVLDDLDLQLRDLESGVNVHPSSEMAFETVEQFFITCQIAENVIKYSGLKGYVSKEQIQELNQEMKHKVERMIALSRRSEVLDQALQHSRRAQTVLALQA
jgi:hypothetical protein